MFGVVHGGDADLRAGERAHELPLQAGRPPLLKQGQVL